MWRKIIAFALNPLFHEKWLIKFPFRHSYITWPWITFHSQFISVCFVINVCTEYPPLYLFAIFLIHIILLIFYLWHNKCHLMMENKQNRGYLCQLFGLERRNIDCTQKCEEYLRLVVKIGIIDFYILNQKSSKIHGTAHFLTHKNSWRCVINFIYKRQWQEARCASQLIGNTHKKKCYLIPQGEL